MRLFPRRSAFPQQPAAPVVHFWHTGLVTRAFFEDSISSNEQWLSLKQRLADAAVVGEIPGARLPDAGRGPFAHVRVYINYLAVDREAIYNEIAEQTILGILSDMFSWLRVPQAVNDITSLDDCLAQALKRHELNMMRPKGPQVNWFLGGPEYRDHRRPSR